MQITLFACAQRILIMQVKPVKSTSFWNFERHGRKVSRKVDRKSVPIRLQIVDFAILLESKCRSNDISNHVALY